MVEDGELNEDEYVSVDREFAHVEVVEPAVAGGVRTHGVPCDVDELVGLAVEGGIAEFVSRDCMESIFCAGHVFDPNEVFWSVVAVQVEARENEERHEERQESLDCNLRIRN